MSGTSGSQPGRPWRSYWSESPPPAPLFVDENYVSLSDHYFIINSDIPGGNTIRPRTCWLTDAEPTATNDGAPSTVTQEPVQHPSTATPEQASPANPSNAQPNDSPTNPLHVDDQPQASSIVPPWVDAVPPKSDTEDDVLVDPGKVARVWRLDPKTVLELTNNDIESVKSPNYWNDNIINFCLTRHWSEVEDRDSIHIFASHFASAILEPKASVEKTKPWWKKVDVFSKRMVIVPVNAGNVHWYLAVVINPGAILAKTKASALSAKAVGLEEPVILTCDSRPVDRTGIAKALNKWLVDVARTQRPHLDDVGLLKSSQTFPAAHRQLRVPLQPNTYDCGVYVAHFAGKLIKNMPELDIFQDTSTESEEDTVARWGAADISGHRKQWLETIALLPPPENHAQPPDDGQGSISIIVPPSADVGRPTSRRHSSWTDQDGHIAKRPRTDRSASQNHDGDTAMG